MTDAGTPTLYVLPPSHYCERARWSLHCNGIAFREVRWAAGLHVPLARRLAPATALPILQTGEQVIQGSGAIVDWIGMGGDDAEVETRFEKRIAVLLRRYVYSRTLLSRQGAPAIKALLLDGVTPWQKLVGAIAWPGVRRAMVKVMDVRPDLVPQMEDEIARELDWFEGRIGDRRYLVGDQFGRADLTAASLMSPMIGSPGMASRIRSLDDLFARFADRPALAWVRRIYRDHRGGAAISSPAAR